MTTASVHRPSPAPLPLTPLQQGMYFTWLQDPAAGIDMEQMVCTLPEALDVPRLRAAWEALTAAHDALRATFTAETITIHDHLPPAWQELDFSQEDREPSENPHTPDELQGAFLEQDRTTPLDLTTGPLQRLALIRLGPADYRLIWTFHHILIDGRAITALLQEVFALYDQTASPKSLPSFQSHNLWQAALDHTPSAPFWKNHFTSVSGPTPLVVEHLEPGILLNPTTPHAAQAEADHYLSPELTASLRTLATTLGVTLNTLVQAAFALLLGRYAGEDRVIFGATRACRHTPVPGSENTIGLLINTLPLTVDLPSGQPLRGFLETLRQHWLDLRPHEHTPLSFIRRSAGLSTTAAPFNHLLVFENDDYTNTLRATGGPAFANRSFHLRELTSVPLTLAVYGGESLRLHCAFQPATFDLATIQRLLGHMAQLLEQFAAASPETPLSAFHLTTPAERQLLLHDWQPTDPQVNSETTLHDWFSKTAEKYPDRVAVTAEDATWTYAELDRRSHLIAQDLITANVKPGDFVGICMDRRAPLIAALLGILKAGAAYLPIDLAYPPERLAFMLQDAQAPALLTERPLADKIPENPATTLFIEDIDFSPSCPSCPSVQIPQDPDSLAYIIYTSGSTGLPKGCQITHRNVVRLMKATDPWYGFNESDVWTLFHSTAFDFSVWELWGALLYGGRLVVVPWLTTRSPDDFFKLLCEERVTVLNQTPSAFRQLIQAETLARSTAPNLPPQSLRYVIFGGEALEMQSLKPWYDRHGDTAPVLVNMYGITETTVHVTYRPLSARDLDSGSVIGIPIPDLQLYILDPDNLQPVPIGIPGEMYIAGPGLATGYLRREALTAERFIPNHFTGTGRLYKTGDLARFIPGGRSQASLDIEYLGRIDHQVKIRGFRIELGEIENILTSHPEVHEAAVLAREDRPGDKRLCAYLVPANPASPPSPDDLRALLKTRVPDYMVPAAFVYLPSFPITPNGKLDRKALPAPATEGPATTRPFQSPATPAEEALTTIWTAVLRLDRVSTTDNFFEIGGDSILSIQVIARAREAGLALTPRQLFEHPTIASLAGVAQPLASQLPTLNAQPSPGDLTSAFPLTPIQRWFFAQKLADSHHWNQSFVFTLSDRLTPDALRAALQNLVQHHPALRLRFRQENDGWIPSIAAEETADLLTVHNSLENLETNCADLQTTLNYQTGPLLRAALFDAGEDRPGRLCLTVHHLAVDGVSWRILLEDLESLLLGKSLPAATSSWPQWARQIAAWPDTPAAQAQAAYWSARPTSPAAPVTREADAFTRTVRLSEDSTTALLQRVPSAWRTRINDVLLTALALAYGQPSLSLNLEGHGREQALAGPLTLDRTIGWFTAIFPVHLNVPDLTPAAALPAIKEQLRAIPENGSGYQFLGCGSRSSDAPFVPQPLLFNYLGQIDALTNHSSLFSFAAESSGPWHAPTATRAHALEINAMVIHGRLEAAFTAAAPAHTPEEIDRLAQAFLTSLESIIDYCLTLPSPRATPSDFPLAALDQPALDRLLSAHLGVSDICRLSPMQQLFHNAALTKPNAGYDHWSCRITGPVDPQALRAAWTTVVQRHPILRSTFHSAGLPHPVMLVHEVGPGSALTEIPWTFAESNDAGAIDRLVSGDASRINDLTKPLCGRFTLLRLAENDHFFLWSVPDLQLDGWSWPIVFGEASALYRELTGGPPAALPHPRPYRDYLNWLSLQPAESSDAYWKEYLAGFTAPTAIPVETIAGPRASRRTAESRAVISGQDLSGLLDAARRSAVTPGVMVQAAWAALLSHCAGTDDVVFGTAFSGRPADLPGADRIVGPFVNNLPVRVSLPAGLAAAGLLKQVHRTLTDLATHQFTPLPRIQDCSAVPWRFRLFDSLIVFQNYEIDPALTRLGSQTVLGGFDGPIHTNYALTLVITPRENDWELLLVYQESACSAARAANLLHDFTAVLLGLANSPEKSVSNIAAAGLLPAACSPAHQPPARPGTARQAPRTPMEQRLATLWQRAFGLTEISITDNFFDLGGHSLLMLRVHQAMCQELNRPLPVVTLFQYPTIATLAAHLHPAPASPNSSNAAAPSAAPSIQNRAAAARAAAAKAAAARR